MSTLRVDTIQNRTGGDLITAKGMARAWVNFNGTGTVAIRTSFNVTSVTDNGVGDYTVNFTSAMADANYAWSGSLNNNGGNYLLYGKNVAPTTTEITVQTGSTTAAIDSDRISVAVFR